MNIENKKLILITGGAGFIGSNIVERLHNSNYRVRILDCLITGKMENIKSFLNNNVEFVYGDISNIDICRNAMKGVDIVCHQAALGSVPRSIDDPLTSHNMNVNGFLNILIAMKENNVKRIVYASSSSVYGDNNTLPKVENKVGDVLSPYAATKKIDEIYANVFHRCYGLETIGLRYFNVFGPRQDPNGVYAAVIPKFMDMLMNNITPTINGDGEISRDFTYIDNVVDANILAMTTTNNEAFGKVINIGAGGRITLNEMYNIIKTKLNSNINPLYGPNRKGDIMHSNANIDLAYDILNYEPKISFEEGIEKYINCVSGDSKLLK